MAMSRSRGRTFETSLPPIRMCPASSGSSPASILSAVDLPEPEGPTRTRSSPSLIVRFSLSTAALGVPGYRRGASSYWPEAISVPSLERAHRQSANHSLLRRPAGEDDRDAGDDRRSRELGQEVA